MNLRAKIGQLVRLRAGGPILNVAGENLLDDGSYSYCCQWFECETLRYGTFHIAALESVEGEFEPAISEHPENGVEAEAESEAEAAPGKDYH